MQGADEERWQPSMNATHVQSAKTTKDRETIICDDAWVDCVR